MEALFSSVQDIYDRNDYSSIIECRFWNHALWENQCCSLNLVIKLTQYSLYKLRTTIYLWPWMPRMIHKLCSECLPLIVYLKNNNNMTYCDAHCHYFNPLSAASCQSWRVLVCINRWRFQIRVEEFGVWLSIVSGKVRNCVLHMAVPTWSTNFCCFLQIFGVVPLHLHIRISFRDSPYNGGHILVPTATVLCTSDCL